MSIIRTLTATAAAASLVGALGFVYAQSTPTDAISDGKMNSSQTVQPAAEPAADPAANSSSAMPNGASSSTTSTGASTSTPSSDSSAQPAERAPKADRG